VVIQRLPDSTTGINAGSAPRAISHITLEVKVTGKRSAGNPHAAFERAGTGDGLTERLVRHSQRKRGVTDRSILRGTAPVLDPTDLDSTLHWSYDDPVLTHYWD
jgi:hypothetical protein